jgi:CRP/FNR family transcriptional regulator, cyclic AMP receptor protein
MIKKTRGFQVDTIQFLRSVSLFSGLKESSIDLLAQGCRLQHYQKGTYIFYQTDPADSAFVVRNGSVAIVLSSQDGRELIINEMRTGQCFGELALLTSLPRSTAAVAREKCDILIFPRLVFLKVLDDDPYLPRRLLEITAERLSSSSERESAMTFLDAPARLARILLQMDQAAIEKGYLITSQDELAQRTGLARQTVATTLGKWRRKGWLITGRGRIIVLDHPSLERLSNLENK